MPLILLGLTNLPSAVQLGHIGNHIPPIISTHSSPLRLSSPVIVRQKQPKATKSGQNRQKAAPPQYDGALLYYCVTGECGNMDSVPFLAPFSYTFLPSMAFPPPLLPPIFLYVPFLSLSPIE